MFFQQLGFIKRSIAFIGVEHAPGTHRHRHVHTYTPSFSFMYKQTLPIPLGIIFRYLYAKLVSLGRLQPLQVAPILSEVFPFPRTQTLAPHTSLPFLTSVSPYVPAKATWPVKGNKTKVHGHCLPKCLVLVHSDPGNTEWETQIGCQVLVYLRKGQWKKIFPLFICCCWVEDKVGLQNLEKSTHEVTKYSLPFLKHCILLQRCYKRQREV